MRDYVEKVVQCPNCGHQTTLALDASNGDQDYYEDCSVCCNTMHCRLVCDHLNDKLKLFVDADDEQFF